MRQAYLCNKEEGLVYMFNFENEMSGQVAVIPKGTVIKGNIEMTGKLEMNGEIQGNIKSNDTIELCGEVKGNLDVKELRARDSFIEGQIICESNANIQENTVVLGDIIAQNLQVEGAIQGNLDVKGSITLGDKAIVDSEIKAQTIEVSEGAAINGHCSLCYANIDMNTLFPETKGKKK